MNLENGTSEKGSSRQETEFQQFSLYPHLECPRTPNVSSLRVAEAWCQSTGTHKSIAHPERHPLLAASREGGKLDWQNLADKIRHGHRFFHRTGRALAFKLVDRVSCVCR